MLRIKLFIIGLAAAFAIASCSKRNHPEKTATEGPANDTAVAIKNAEIKSKKTVPKVIVVNDNAARKSVDGRYYYDLMGHRYWRNNKDGKYYLFNKSMYNDDAFKPPVKKN